MSKRFRILGLASALTLTSVALARASAPGVCHVSCSNGTTAGPYSSTPESCCQDLQRLCGAGGGSAYTVLYQGTPFQTIVDCFDEGPPI